MACLLAQYIEYFHYGGRGRRDEGHLIRIGSVNKPSKIKTFMLDYMKRIAARGAKIYAGAESESEEEEGLEEDNESEDDEETGQPKAKKVVINVKDANSDTVRPMSPSGKELALTSPNISRPSSPSRDQQQQHALTTATANGEKKGATDVEQPPEVEENPEDYHDWSCIVCNTANHALKYNPNAGVEIYFGEKGAFYKHMYAHLIFQTTKPRCKKCYTVFDYKPPPGSAHIFPHNPDPHTAFKVYPKPVRVQNGLKTDKYSIYYNYFISLLFGLKNNIKSMPTINDWRLKKYIIDHFPKIPKYELKSDERYEVGEILECKLQKSEYYRARIIYVHPNGTYNIRFDQGDELRFVQRHDLRLGTEKRAFAYRVELGLVIMVVSFPLCLILAIMSGDMGIVFLSMFLISLLMFITRIKMLIQYAVNFYQAGICVIGRLSLFYILPVFFFFLTSAVGLTSGGDPGSWGSIVALAIMMKVFAIPVIYAQRPFYAIMASSIFLQTSIGLILLSSWGTAAKRGYIAIPLAPFITTILTFKYYRKHLHNIWDACLIIRRASDDSKNNPSIFLTCWFYLSKAINYIKMLQGY